MLRSRASAPEERLSRFGGATAAALLAAALLSCSSKKDATSPAAPSCDERVKVSGVCPGVPASPVCADSKCTQGAACTRTIDVGDSAALKAAASSATSGTCIAVAPGSYDGVVHLAAGVSLLGSNASTTSVEGVDCAVESTSTALVRGLTVQAGGLYAQQPGRAAGTAAGALVVDQIIVKDANEGGIRAIDVSLTVTASTIEGGAATAVYGILGQCVDGKPCVAPQPSVVLRRVRVHDVPEIGVWLRGVSATLEGVTIESVRVVGHYSRGLEVDSSAQVTGSALAVTDTQEVAVLVDGASADLSDFIVTRNLRGVQLQATPLTPATKLSNFEISKCAGASLGLHNAAQGIIIQGGLVASTGKTSLVTGFGASEIMGDGLQWMGGSSATIDKTVTFQANARFGAIIDASATGVFDAKLGGGDEITGIIIQGGTVATPPAGLTTGAGLAVHVELGQKYPVAAAIVASK